MDYSNGGVLGSPQQYPIPNYNGDEQTIQRTTTYTSQQQQHNTGHHGNNMGKNAKIGAIVGGIGGLGATIWNNKHEGKETTITEGVLKTATGAAIGGGGAALVTKFFGHI